MAPQIYIVTISVPQWRRQEGERRERGERTPQNPEKLAKGWEQLTPLPAVSHDIKRKFKFLLIFKNFIKFFKFFFIPFKIFKISSNFLQIFLKKQLYFLFI